MLVFKLNATPENLRSELANLSYQWEVLKLSPLEEYETRFDDYEDEISSDEDDTEPTNKSKKKNESCNKKKISCKKCCICCFRILNEYNLLTGAYPNIGLAYEYLLSLSFTQVACERSFNFLKFIKNKLRSSVNQDKLDSFMLMAIEQDILQKIPIETIVDKMAEKSSVFKNLLVL